MHCHYFRCLFVIALFLGNLSIEAAPLYWDTNGTANGSGSATGIWGGDAFWNPIQGGGTGGSFVTATTNQDNLFISAGTNGTTGTITAGSVFANSITFDDPVAVTISGGDITLGGLLSGAGIFQTANGASTISTGIILDAATTTFSFSNSGSALLTIGAVTGGAGNGDTQTIVAGTSGSGSILLNGIVGDGLNGGNVALTVNSVGTGATILSAANTYTGPTLISSGTLQLGNSGTTGSISLTSTITNNGNLAINRSNAVLQGVDFGTITGTGSFTQAGTGTTTLTTVNTYAGPTRVQAGMLTLNSATGSLSNSSNLIFRGSAIFNMDNTGASGALAQSLGALSFSAGEGTVMTTRSVNFDQVLAFVSLAARSRGATGNFVNAGTNGAANGFTITTAPSVGQLTDRGIFYNGSNYAAYDSGGFVRAYTAGDTNHVSVVGGATMGSPRLATDNVALTGDITAQTTVDGTVNTIHMGAFNISMSASTQIVSTNGLLSTGSSSATLGSSGGILQATTPGGEMVIRVNGSSDKLTIGSIIQNNTTPSSITKSGAGTLVLTGANTFSGGLNLNAGTLSLGSAAALGARPSMLNIAAGTALDSSVANLVVGNTNIVIINGDFSFVGTQNLNLGIGGVSLGSADGTNRTITTVANTLTIGGIITNGTSATGLIKDGAGTLILTGQNTYTGATTISGGILTLGGAGTLGAGAYAGSLEIASGASLSRTGTAAQSITGVISGAGSVTQAGTGALTLTAANTYTGTTTVTTGNLTVSGNAGSISGSSGYHLAGGTLQLTAGTPNINILNDSGVVSLSGGGTLILTGNATTNTSETFGSLAVGAGSQTVTIGSQSGRVTTLSAGAVSNSLTRSDNGTALIRGTSLDQSAATFVSRFMLGDNGASLGLVGTNTLNNGITSDTTQALKIVPYLIGDASTTGLGSNFVTYDSTLGLRVLNAGESTLLATGYTTAVDHDNVTAGINVTLTNAAGIAVNSILFNSPADSTLNSTNSNALTVDSGAVASVVNQTNTIGSGFSQLLLGNGEGVVTVTQGTLSINTPVDVSSNGGLTKAGAGTLSLNTANLYSGATTINAGVLNIQNATALGSTAAGTTVIFGAALQIQGGISVGAEALTLNGAGISSGGALRNISGNNTYAGLVTLGSATRINSDTAGTTLTLSNAGTITGAGFALTVGGTGNTAISSAIGTAGGSLTKDGVGTLTLTGANTYTGGTTVNRGTLLLSGAINMPATGTLQVNAGGNFSLADGTARNTTTAALSLASGSTLTFDWNAGNVDTLSSTATATTATGSVIGIIINPNAPNGTALTLLSAPSGLLTGTTQYLLSNNTNFTATLAQSDTAVTIGGFALVTAPATFYWQGNKIVGANLAGVDNALALSNGTTSNWSSTLGSYTAVGVVPGSTANLIFSNTSPTPVLQNTVLGADMTVNSITFNDTSPVTIGGSNNLTLLSSGTGASSAIVVNSSSAAAPTINANVGLGANQTWTIASGKTLTVGGAISGGSTLTKAGSGTVVLTGANTYTGATMISEGTLGLALSGTLGGGNYAGNIDIASGASFINYSFAPQTLSGVVSGSGSLAQFGSGTLTLTGANTFTGTTTIAGGILQIGNGATGSLNGTIGTALTFTGAGTFNVSEASGVSQGMGVLSFSAGDGIVQSTNNGGTSSLTFTSLTPRSAGATGNFVLSGGTIGTPGNPGTPGTNNIVFTAPPPAGAMMDRGLFYNGSAYAAYDAGGFVRAYASGDTNYLSVAGGPSLGTPLATDNVALAGSISAQTTSNAVNTINMGGFNIVMSSPGQILSTNGLLSSGAAAATLGGTGSILQTTTPGGEMVIRVNGSADKLTITSIIQDNTSSSSLTKSGAGTLTLTGANTFSGGLTVAAGTLDIGSASALGTGTLVIENGVIFSSTTSGLVNANNNAITINGNFSTPQSALRSYNFGTGAVSLGTAAGETRVITINASYAGQTNWTIGGNISNGTTANSLFMYGGSNGGGTLRLSGSNSYSGTTTIAAGTLSIATINALPGWNENGRWFVGNVSGLAQGNSTLAMGNGVSDAEIVTMLATMNFSAGTLVGFDTVAGNRTFSSNLSDTAQGRLGLQKIGSNALTLTGSNTFTGTILVYEGELVIGSTTALPTGNGMNQLGILSTSLASVAVNNTIFLNGGAAFFGSATNTGTMVVSGTFLPNNTGRGVSVAANTIVNITGSIVNPSNGARADFNKTGAGTLVLSNSNTYEGGTTLTNGTLQLNYEGNGGLGVLGTLTLNGGTLMPVNAARTVVNPMTLTAVTIAGSQDLTLSGVLTGLTGGARTLINNLDTGSTLTLGAVNINADTLVRSLTIAGTGNTNFAGIIYNGNGAPANSLIINSTGITSFSNSNVYTGGTTVNRGTLLLSGAITLPSTGTVLVNGGGNLSLADGTARTTTTALGASLSLANGANLSFDWNAGAVDTLNLTAPAVTINGNIIGIIINPTNAPSGTGLTLLNAPSGLQTGTTKYFLANNTNFTATLTQSDTAVTIGGYTSASALTNAFWKGGQLAGAPGSMALSNGTVSNWASDASGTSAGGVVPGSAANLFFSTTAGATQQAAITLGADMTVNRLTFNDSAAVTIGGNNNLTLLSTGTEAASAIVVSSSSAAITTINTNVGLGANQSWKIAGGKTLAVGGAISGNYSLTKADAGALILTGVNTYTGSTTISGGTFTLGGVGTLGSGTYAGAIDIASGASFIYNSTAAQTLNGVISGSGVGLLVQAGTLTLGGVNTYTGPTTVNGGTLIADTIAAPVVISSSSTLVLGGGTFQLRGQAISTHALNFQRQVFNGLTLNAGSSVVDANNVGASISTTIDLRGTGGLLGITRNAGAVVDFKATVGGSPNTTTAIIKTHQANDASGILGAWATVNGGADLARNDGNDNIVAYTGYVNIDALGPSSTILDATLSNVRINAAGTSGTITLGSAAVNINTLMQNTTTAAIVDISGKNLRLGSVGTILLTPTASTTGTLTIGIAANDGVLTAGGNTSGVAGELIFNNPVLNATTTVNAVIANNGGGALTVTKSGIGTLVLNGTNTFSGGVFLNAGKLTLGSTTALGATASTLTIAAGSTLDSSLANIVIANNNAITINGDFTFTGTQNLNLGTGAISLGTAVGTSRTITTAAAATTLTLGGVISDGTTVSALTKAGPGTLALTGANTYTGKITINAGTLAINTIGDVGAASSALGAPATAAIGIIDLAATGTLRYIGSTAGSSNRIINLSTVAGGSFTLDASGSIPFALSGGVVSAGTSGTSTLTLTGAGLGSESGVIANGTGSNFTAVTKTGGGTWTLSGANTYAGKTTISVGTLAITNLADVGASSALGAPTTAASATIDLATGATLKFIGSAAGSSNRVINLSTVAGGTFTLDASGSTPFVLSGGVISAGTSSTLTLTGSTSGSQSGVIANGTGSNVTALTKNGTGVWTLSGSNSYTGATTINAGTLTFSGAGSLVGSTGLITIADAGTLALSNTTTNTTNRLGGRAVTFTGGTLSVVGNNIAALNETAGTLSFSSGHSIISMTAGGSNTSNILNFSTYTLTAGATFAVTGTGLGTTSGDPAKVNVKITGTAPTLTGGIVAASYGNDGTNSGFLTYSATNGFRVLTGADYGTFPLQPTLTPFTSPAVSTSNVLLTSNQTYNADTTINSLTLGNLGGITSTGATVNPQIWDAAGSLNSLTLTSGGIIANIGNVGIANGNLNAAAVGFIFNTQANLTNASYLTASAGGITKTGSADFNLNTQSYVVGATTINEGKIVLGSGVANTLLVSPTATVATLGALVVNQGGTLDLNGKDQAVGTISSVGTFTGTGGTITSTGAVNLFSNSATTATTFSGVIDGAISFYKSGTTGVLTLNTAQTYTGSTTVQGGGLTLADFATLASAGTAANGGINVNGGTLTLTNTGFSDVTARFSATAALTLNSGTFVYQGGTGLNSVATVGNGSGSGLTATSSLVLAQGASVITVTQGTGGSAELNIPNLARVSGTTLNFTGTTLGTAGNNPRIFLSHVNGSALTLTGNILGGWATVGDNWATYNQDGTGVANTLGIQAVAAAAYTAITTVGLQSSNTTVSGNYSVRVNSATPVQLASGGNTVNSLQIAPTGTTAGQILDLNGTLTVTTGGILRTSANSATQVIQNGMLTAGTSGVGGELFIALNNAATTTISALIADNGGGAVSLVKAGTGAGALILTGNNAATGGYTGMTTVNAGTLTLSTVSADGSTIVAVPGNLTVNNGGTVTLTAAGQIKNTSAITINGGGTLTMAGASNALASLTFNNNGGAATPTVATGTLLSLSAVDAITVVNDNYAITPTISGTALQFTGTAPVLNVSGLSPTGLSITAAITGSVTTGLTKTGAGNLILSVANTYTSTVANTGFVLQDGGLILNNATALGNAANRLVIGNGSTTTPLSIMSVGATAIANATIVGQNFTFGGTLAANLLTLSGAMDLGGATRTITVTSPTVTGSITGAISNGGITKEGNGILSIGGAAANTYTGATTVNAGLLKLLAPNVIADTSALKVNLGAAFDAAGRPETVGSLADGASGGGLITNSGAIAIFSFGADNTSTGFSGFITQGALAVAMVVNKIGTGTQTLTGANAYSGATTVTNGGLTLSGSAGTLYTGLTGLSRTVTIANGGTITLDNSGSNVTNRLGGSTSALTLGGTLNIIGSSSGALTEQLGAVTLAVGQSTINFTLNGGTSNNLSLLSYTATAGSTLFISGTGLGNGAPSATRANVAVLNAPPVPTGTGPGILANAIGDDGTNKGFLTYDTNGFRVLTTAELSTFPIQPTAPVQTGVVLGLSAVFSTPNNIVVSTAAGGTMNMTQSTTVNSLTLNSGGGILSAGANQVTTAGVPIAANGNFFNAAAALNTLTISSGGIVSYSGNTGIKGGVITSGAVALTIHTPDDLTIGSYLTGTGGLIKADTGILTLSKTSFITHATIGTTVNAGTLKLNSGTANALVVTPTNTGATFGNLIMNGGTLDLFGKDQAVGTLTSTNAAAGGLGGSVDNTSLTFANFITLGAATQFDGFINGAINYYKAGTVGTQVLVQANTYSGTTNVQGLGLTLKDYGSILNSSTININGGTFFLDNTGITDIARLKSTVVINLNGGTLSYTGQLGQGSTVAIGSGNTNLLMGLNTITATAVSGPATMTIANLVRTAGATANFTGTGLGTAGNTPRIMLTQVNTAAPALTGNILGGWATVGDNWATYNQDGTGTLNTLGVQGIIAGAYTVVNTTGTLGAATTSTGNYSIQVNSATPVQLAAVPNTVNSLQIAPTGTAGAILNLNGNTLVVTTGGIMRSSANSANTTIQNGTLTAGTGGSAAELFFVLNNTTNAMTVSVLIADNTSSGPVTLVKTGTGSGPLTLAPTISNTYTGGTFVNSGTLNLGAGSALNVIPGSLTINNGGTVAMTTSNAQIAAASNITLNGGAVLTFAGLTGAGTSQTLASLTFINNGGTATPTVTPNGNSTGTLTLSGATAITANSYNAATVATIAAGTANATGNLVFGATNAIVNVTSNDASGAFISKVTPDLNIAAQISNASGGASQLNKTGNGTLALTGANLNTAGWKITDGTLILANATALGTVAGTFTIGDATTANAVPITLMAGSAAIVVGANPIVLNRDVTFGGTVATNNLTFGGTVALGAANRTITVTSPQVTATLNGVISSTGAFGIIKEGDGILTLGGSNNYTGVTTINAGVLKLVRASTTVLPAGTDVTIGSTGMLDVAFQTGRIIQTISSLAGSGVLTNSGILGTLTIGNSVPTNTTFSGTITQGASVLNIAKTGSSVQTLTGVSTYNGSTAISGTGGIIVNGSLANTNVTVASGSFLGGTGTIGVTNNAQTVNTGGSVTVNSGGAIDLSRDNAIGTLTINANTTATAALSMTSGILTVNTNATATDQIAIGNNAKAAVTTALTVNLAGISGTTLAAGIYNLINYAAGNGSGLIGIPGTTTGITKGTDTSFFDGSTQTSQTTSFNVTSTALQLIVGTASQSYFWNGSSATWSAGSSWNTTINGGVAQGGAPTSVATVNFVTSTPNGNASLTTALDTPTSVNGIVFNSSLTSPVTINDGTGTNSLTLNAAGIISQSGQSATIQNAGGVILAATQAWQTTAAGNIIVSAPVSGSGGLVINGTVATGKVILGSATANTYTGGTTVAGTVVGNTLQLATSSSNALGAVTNTLAVNLGTLDLNGNNATVGSLTGTGTSANSVITNTLASSTSTLKVNQSVNSLYQGAINDTGSGKVALTKEGVGILVLAPSALSTYSGGTIINGGTIQVGNGTAATEPTSGAANSVGVLGTGLVTVNTGGTLTLNGFASTVFNIPNSLTLNGGTLINTLGQQHIGFTGGSPGSVTGTITIGAGGGTIQNNGAVTASDLFLDGALTGSGALNILGGGTGLVRFTNENGGAFATNTYTGTLTITNTTNAKASVDTSNALAGASVVNLSALGIGFSNTVVTSASFGSLAGTGTLALSNLTPAGVALTVGANGESTAYSGVISGTNAGTALIKTGSGVLTLSGVNTFTGGAGNGLVIAQGAVLLTTNAVAGGAVGQAITLNNANTGTINTSLLNNGLTVTNAINVTANGTGTTILGALNGNATFSGGITLGKDLTLTATAGNTLTIQTLGIDSTTAGTKTLTYTGPGNGTISSNITNTSGSVALTVNDTYPGATLTLSGVNTYSGATTVTAGILTTGTGGATSGASNLSPNSAITLANSSLATLTMAATTGTNGQWIGSLAGGGSSGGNVILGLSGSKLVTGNDNTDTSYAGVISGAGNLVKAGTGTFTLSGTSTYTGSTTVNSGTLRLGSSSTGSNGPVGTGGTAAVFLGDTTGTSNASLLIHGGFTVANAITVQTGSTSNTLTLGSSAVGAAVFSGAVNLGTSGANPSRDVSLIAVAGGSVNFSGVLNENTSNNTLANVTVGDGTNTGTVILSNLANAYGGITTINGGTLEITKIAAGNSDSSIGNSGSAVSNLVINGGTLKYTGTSPNGSTNRLFTIGSSGATIDASSSDNTALTFTGVGSLVASGSGNRTLTLTGISSAATINSMESVIADPGTGATSLAKNGSNTWALKADNTYSGTTAVNEGLLQVGSSSAGKSGTGATTVADGAAVFGTGVVQGTTVSFASGSTLYAGDDTSFASHGTLAFTPQTSTGGATHDLQGNVILDITGATATNASYGGTALGTPSYEAWVDGITGVGSHDRLVFNNSADSTNYTFNFLTTTGSLQVGASGFTPQNGQVFNLLDWGSIVTANFAGFNAGTNYRTGKNSDNNEGAFDLPDIESSGYVWDVSRFTSSGNIVIVTASLVPEPSRMLLLVLGFALALFRRRRPMLRSA